MRVFLVSTMAAVVLSISSMFILDNVVQRNANEAFSSSTSVRLPDHGNTHNLVGRDWYSAKEHGWGDEIQLKFAYFESAIFVHETITGASDCILEDARRLILAFFSADLTAFWFQRMRDYCIGMISSR